MRQNERADGVLTFSINFAAGWSGQPCGTNLLLENLAAFRQSVGSNLWT
jgi:hypothetical protein